jgi:hypothetical protein
MLDFKELATRLKPENDNRVLHAAFAICGEVSRPLTGAADEDAPLARGFNIKPSRYDDPFYATVHEWQHLPRHEANYTRLTPIFPWLKELAAFDTSSWEDADLTIMTFVIDTALGMEKDG